MKINELFLRIMEILQGGRDVCIQRIRYEMWGTLTSIMYNDLDTKLNFPWQYLSIRQKKHNSSEFMNILELLRSGVWVSLPFHI